MSKEKMYQMSLVTLAGFSIIGFLLIHFLLGENIAEVFFKGQNWKWQILIGASYGLYAAIFMSLVISYTPLQKISDFYTKLFAGLNLKFADIAFYSFCAGVGEEILFRGAIQYGFEGLLANYYPPHLAIWLIAFIFVALHLYFDFSDWRMMLNATLLVLVSAGLGYLFHYIGLISAIIAHFIFDLVIFSYLIYTQEKSVSQKTKKEVEIVVKDEDVWRLD